MNDTDVEMEEVKQPIYEFIKAPKPCGWDQPSLIAWHRERRLYERKIEERCAITGENSSDVLVSFKNSMEPTLVDRVAKYVLKEDVDLLTDELLISKINERIGQLQNQHIPDVEELFRKELKMNLSEADVEARVMNYFGDFDRLIEDNGLKRMLGAGKPSDEDYKDRMKHRCKLLIANLAPEVLRLEISRLLSLQERAAKTNDVKLFELVLRRAKEQHHFHLLEKERGGPSLLKRSDNGKHKRTMPKKGNKPVHTGTNGETPVRRQTRPPVSGCWVCKGEHWLRDCPTATEEEKQQAIQDMKRVKDQKPAQVKAIRVGGSEATRNCVIVNDVFELPFRADTGADGNFIPRKVVNELKELGIASQTQTLLAPVVIEVARGHRQKCHEEIVVDLRIGTAVGSVNLRNVKCFIIEGEEQSFLLGEKTLRSMGIDVQQMLEQLAGCTMEPDAGDDIPEVETVGNEDDLELKQELEMRLKEAEDSGFPREKVNDLRMLVFEFQDVWRMRLGPGGLAKVNPLRITLQPGSQPYRCKQRRYAPAQSKFLDEYVQELIKFGLVRKNSNSHWACPSVPVRKVGEADSFRLANDYRPVNAMTVPLAGTSPNLAVATNHVRGSTAVGSFDLFKGFWQFPLHTESQEIFSFMTDKGVFTPVSVRQGAMDSSTHFQSEMENVFKTEMYTLMLIWIDDLIVFARDIEAYLASLRKVFSTLSSRNLKLSATKSVLYAEQVTWCGKVISGEGVRQDPRRLEALKSLPLPTTAAELQYFLCAANWMRDSYVD